MMFLFELQEKIDIFEGVTDEIAERMATNLQFKGPQHKEVIIIKEIFNRFYFSEKISTLEGFYNFFSCLL